MDMQSGAMRACTTHLHPKVQLTVPISPSLPIYDDQLRSRDSPQKPGGFERLSVMPHAISDVAKDVQISEADVPPTDDQAVMPDQRSEPTVEYYVTIKDQANSGATYDIVYEASKAPLDGAIAASISSSVSESKIKAAAMSILLIGGSSALKGLGTLLAER